MRKGIIPPHLHCRICGKAIPPEKKHVQMNAEQKKRIPNLETKRCLEYI